MRIVGGKWRGRQIEAPEGRAVTRPTTDRTREQIASMILSAAGLDLSDRAVLDAFAGSGAMGLELLSRGAERATFVDRDRRAVARVKRTAEGLGAAPGEVCALGGDVFKMAESGLAGAPFGVVFLDPPYAVAAADVSALVACLAAMGQLSEGAIVVYEHAVKQPGLEVPSCPLKKSKTRGITAVDLHVYGSSTKGEAQ